MFHQSTQRYRCQYERSQSSRCQNLVRQKTKRFSLKVHRRQDALDGTRVQLFVRTPLSSKSKTDLTHPTSTDTTQLTVYTGESGGLCSVQSTIVSEQTIEPTPSRPYTAISIETSHEKLKTVIFNYLWTQVFWYEPKSSLHNKFHAKFSILKQIAIY